MQIMNTPLKLYCIKILTKHIPPKKKYGMRVTITRRHGEGATYERASENLSSPWTFFQ